MWQRFWAKAQFIACVSAPLDYKQYWDQGHRLFLIAYRFHARNYRTQSNKRIFGRKLRLACNLKFDCSPRKCWLRITRSLTFAEKWATDWIHSNSKKASDRMNRQYNVRNQKGGFQGGKVFRFYNPQRGRTV